MTARWRYLDAAGLEAGRSDEFTDREAADAWLTERWAELAEAGVDAVELVEEGNATFRMSLRPSEDG
jgi:hypothetical protein